MPQTGELRYPMPEDLQQMTLRLISEEKAHQLLFLQTFRDAAILAGEQVQDKRLDLLESPPGVTANDILLDAFISLALGPVARQALRILANKGLRSVLGIRASISERNGSYTVAPYTAQTVNAAMRIILDDRLEKVIDPAKQKFELFRKFAEDLIDVPVDVAKRKLRDAATKPAGQQRGAALEMAGDTASVAVRRAALAWARLQEQATEVSLQQLTRQVASASSTDPLLTTVNAMLIGSMANRQVTSPRGNAEIERDLSLLFEACIWIAHFGGVDKMVKTENIVQPLYQTELYIPLQERPGPLRPARVWKLRVDQRLVFYWLQRFPHDRGSGRESFIGYTGDIESATRDLLNWFGQLDGGMKAVELALKDFGFRVLGPVKFKQVAP